MARGTLFDGMVLAEAAINMDIESFLDSDNLSSKCCPFEQELNRNEQNSRGEKVY